MNIFNDTYSYNLEGFSNEKCNFRNNQKGAPQAYIRARASSATLCSVHSSIAKRESDMYQNRLRYISDTHPNPHPLPLMIILKLEDSYGKPLTEGSGNVRGSLYPGSG